MGASPRLMRPPFVRRWTQAVGDDAVVIAVHGGSVYYRSHSGIGALALATGQPRWRSLANRWVAAAVLQDRTLYAIWQGEKGGALAAVDAELGRARTLSSVARSASDLAVDAAGVYVLDQTGV